MRARTLILMALLILGAVGYDWWTDGMNDPAESTEVTAMDGDIPPPTPSP